MGRRTRTLGEPTTVSKILAAAEDHFGAHGFHATRLADIATDAGIKRPSLLYHFRTKELVYTAVLQQALSDLQQQLAPALTDDELQTQLFELIQVLTHFLNERPKLSALVLRSAMSPVSEERQILWSCLEPIINGVVHHLDAFRPTSTDGSPLVPTTHQVVVQTVFQLLVTQAAHPLPPSFLPPSPKVQAHTLAKWMKS